MGIAIKEIADHFDTSYVTTCKAIHGINYKHVS